jgi:ABC-type multidrug transport system fused ATPase/permease subunit
MSQEWHVLKKWFLIGSVVLLIGLAFQWYPSSFISGMRERLSQGGLTADDRTAIQDNLNSWIVWQVGTFQPLSLTLFTAGILVLVYSVLAALFSMFSDYLVSRKQQGAQ